MTETKKQPDESAPPLHSESAEPRPDTEIPEGSKDIPEQVELMEVKALASWNKPKTFWGDIETNLGVRPSMQSWGIQGFYQNKKMFQV